LREMFQKWDINNDGSLSQDEVTTNMAEVAGLFNLDEPDVLALLRAADSNKDGHISYDEFLTAAFDKHKLLNEDNLKKVFSMLDQNNDGTVTQQELQSVFGAGGTDEVLQEIMSSVDVNNDGQISFEEFKSHMD